MDLDTNLIGMLGIAILLALYLRMDWLAMLLGVVIFMMALTTIKIPTQAPQAIPMGGRGNEEILTPVVVTDTGETPYLYPPSFRMKIFPRWQANNFFEWATEGAGYAFSNVFGIMTGRKMTPGDRHVLDVKTIDWYSGLGRR